MRERLAEIAGMSSPAVASDAILLLSRLYPLAERVKDVQAEFWPFCQVVDRAGTLLFFPNSGSSELPEKIEEDLLASFVESGLARGAFRSAGFVSPVVTLESSAIASSYY